MVARTLRARPGGTGDVARLLEALRITGADAFDLQLVATMQADGVQRIYTFNTNDFVPELAPWMAAAWMVVRMVVALTRASWRNIILPMRYLRYRMLPRLLAFLLPVAI